MDALIHRILGPFREQAFGYFCWTRVWQRCRLTGKGKEVLQSITIPTKKCDLTAVSGGSRIVTLSMHMRFDAFATGAGSEK